MSDLGGAGGGSVITGGNNPAFEGAPPSPPPSDPPPSDPPPNDPPPADPAPSDWRQSLPDDLKSDPALQKYNDIASLAKGYVHASKSLGKDKVIVPDKFATDEDWKAFYSKVGMPQKLDEYEVKPPADAKFDDGFQTEFKKFAFEKNLMPHQANEMLDFVHKTQVAEREKVEAQQTERFEESVSNLKKEWGTDLKPRLDLVQSVVREFGGEIEGLFDLLDSSGLGDDPRIIKFLYKLGSGLKDDVITGIEQSSGMAPDEAREEHARMMADPKGPLLNKNHPNHSKAVKEAQRLMELAYPE